MAVLKISFAILTFASLLLILCEAIPVPLCDKNDLVVGGNETSWTIPSSNNFFNEWAEKMDEFVLDDTLTFIYDNKTDSVLEVSEEDYEACETSKPIKEYRDGNTTIELERWGDFYFISGAEGHCEKGQKVKIHTQIDNICFRRVREKLHLILRHVDELYDQG